VKTKNYFAFRVDVWDSAGNNLVEHVAGVDDFETAVATYRAAVRRWPKAKITLRQGDRPAVSDPTGRGLSRRTKESVWEVVRHDQLIRANADLYLSF
jgi:hypothetical protein